MDPYVPVSYTHLDVYKRQAIYGSFILPTFVLFGKGLPLILGSKSLLYVHPVEIPLTFADKDVYNS